MALLYISEIGCSGYALAAREYVLALQGHGRPLTWCPVRWSRGPAEPYRGPCRDAALDRLRARHPVYERVVLHLVPSMHAGWMTECLPQGRGAVAYTVWETDRLPPDWTARLNRLERVLVPCAWNRDVFQASGVRVPVEVVPHMVPADVEDLVGDPAETPFTFYTVAPWTRRKALDLLVEAYCQAFPAGEKVRLVLKTGSRDRTLHSELWGLRHLVNLGSSTARTVARLQAAHRRPPPVELLTGELPRERVLELHRRGHCFVSMSRAEGWGLGAFEAAAAGNPVISPGYGGQMDYLDPELAYLVDFRLAPCRVGAWERHYGENGQRWAEPVVEDAARQMRKVFEHYREAREKAMTLRSRIRERFRKDAVLPALLAGVC